MTASDTTPRRTRVVLGATCFIDAEAALGLATELARQTGAELHGVLVRETAALAATTGRSGTVITYSGTRETGISAEAMVRAFRADARRFQERLSRAARAAALHAAFQQAEGPLPEAVRADARAGDIIVLGIRRVLRAGSDIVVVAPEGASVPAFAEALAQRLGRHLLRLPPGDLLARLDRMSPTAVILSGPQSELPALAKIVQTARCPVIVPLEVPG